MRRRTRATFEPSAHKFAAALCRVMLVLSAAGALWGFGQQRAALESVQGTRPPSYAHVAGLESSLKYMNGLINRSLGYEAMSYNIGPAKSLSPCPQQPARRESRQPQTDPASPGISQQAHSASKRLKRPICRQSGLCRHPQQGQQKRLRVFGGLARNGPQWPAAANGCCSPPGTSTHAARPPARPAANSAASRGRPWCARSTAQWPGAASATCAATRSATCICPGE
jgi:hypothetical protein